MGTLLIIGNGFDLHCGLKTHFSDYFESELRTKKISDFYMNLCQDLHSFDYQQDFSRPLVHLYQDMISLPSVWEACFLALKYRHDNRVGRFFPFLSAEWNDVEKVVRTSLYEEPGAFFSFPRIFALVYGMANQTTLSDQSRAIDNGIEWLLSRLIFNSPRFRDTTILSEKDIKKSKNLFYDYLLNELEIFERSFGLFVHSQIDGNDEYSEKAHSLSSRLSDEARDVTVESFNYSRPQLACCGFRNIHGTTADPVFGIDVQGIDPSDPRYRFTKASRCLSLAIRDEEQPRPNFNLIDKIVIYGHSLNPQDYTYFFNIFKTKRIQDPLSSCELVFPYSVYEGTCKENEQKKLHDSVAGLFNSYDVRMGGPLSTIEFLFSQGRFHFPQI